MLSTIFQYIVDKNLINYYMLWKKAIIFKKNTWLKQNPSAERVEGEMSIPYIITFVFLGIAGIADLIAIIVLILAIVDGIGSDTGKFYSSDFTFELFIHEAEPKSDDNFVCLDNRESGEKEKSTFDWIAVNFKWSF